MLFVILNSMTNPINIMWDCNGTLIDWNDRPIAEAVACLIYLSKLRNVRVGVWSARGKDYADYVVDELLDVRDFVWCTAGKDDPDRPPADIAFDDALDFSQGKFNLIADTPKWSKSLHGSGAKLGNNSCRNKPKSPLPK